MLSTCPGHAFNLPTKTFPLPLPNIASSTDTPTLSSESSMLLGSKSRDSPCLIMIQTILTFIQVRSISLLFPCTLLSTDGTISRFVLLLHPSYSSKVSYNLILTSIVFLFLFLFLFYLVTSPANLTAATLCSIHRFLGQLIYRNATGSGIPKNVSHLC